MTVIPGLVRRAAAEVERRLREGAGVLGRAGRELERSAELVRLLPSLVERLSILEQSARVQAAELRTIRTELDSLVAQLNDRLLPRLDERMDDTERDLAAVATSLIRTGRETAGNHTRLEAAERRVADLRAKVAALEQRTGLWRDLQSTVTRFGDDLDAMRARMALRTAEPPPDSAPAPVQNLTDRLA
ncbi:hypothetical protein [Actinomadura mexicana]|uniref:Uncharacterized protein n=1 Tax=Actinomadura mexicana TaxID=134959 RepID=A0A239DB52_9ACTN|nr:hypothetical protein [Actinomadura mexicana]SNS29288.1 hypothetical protein SAMN06265355_11470 [Actinomadura mexicana]